MKGYEEMSVGDPPPVCIPDTGLPSVPSKRGVIFVYILKETERTCMYSGKYSDMFLIHAGAFISKTTNRLKDHFLTKDA